MKIREFSDNVLGVSDDYERFGIEIEVENAEHVPDTIDTIWHIVEDGSLRNYGKEFITRPCMRADAVEGIRQFYQWFDDYNFDANVRTSTHIHVSVLDFTPAELATMLTVYCIAEPLLFRVCGVEREENIYCVPWYRGTEETSYVRAIVNSRDNIHDLLGTCKYSALYLEPVMRFGTVEFRHAPVFDDAESMVFWLDLVRRLVYNGKLFGTGEEVMKLYDTEGADDFMERVFGENLCVTLRGKCEKSFEDIIDETDSLFVAEACVPSSYTYKVTNQWEPGPVSSATGTVIGYHRLTAVTTSPDEWQDVECDEYFDEEQEEQY